MSEANTPDQAATKPMDGIKVLEFSTMITASFAAMMLAEQGASVIKVEPVELGDPMRYLGSSKGGISALFALSLIHILTLPTICSV